MKSIVPDGWDDATLAVWCKRWQPEELPLHLKRFKTPPYYGAKVITQGNLNYTSYGGPPPGTNYQGMLDGLTSAIAGLLKTNDLFTLQLSFDGFTYYVHDYSLVGVLVGKVATLDDISAKTASYHIDFIGASIKLDVKLLSLKPTLLFGCIQEKLDFAYKEILAAIGAKKNSLSLKFPKAKELHLETVLTKLPTLQMSSYYVPVKNDSPFSYS